MTCNCKNYTHRVLTVNYTGTAIQITVTDSSDIANMERFNIDCHKPVSRLVDGAPVPVSITINGIANVPVKNAYAQDLMSNVVPLGTTSGTYVNDGSNAYVILKTPCYA